MRILIDMQGMQGESRNRGISRYTESFVHALISIAKEHDISLLLNGLYPDTTKQIQQKFKTSLPKTHFFIFDGLWPVAESHPENEQNARISEWIREKFIADISPDFLIVTSLFEGADSHSVTSISAYTSDIPTAVIFYDLIPYIHDDIYLNTPRKKQWYLRKLHALKQADVLLCISFSAQNEAMIYLEKEHSDMTVISSATDKTFHATDHDPVIQVHYGIKRPYIMHTSAYEGRKNFEGLIEAFALLPKSLREEYQLVLVCVLNSKQKNNLLKVAENAGLKKDEMILTGYIPDDDLIAIYTEATLFVFPSKHEGFGLPPLEAMACGTATIGSDSSSIPEVIGRSDALFDPLDTEDIAKKITEVLTDKDFRHALETHALIQAQKFSWKTTAQKALALLEEKHRKQALKKSAKNRTNVQHTSSLLINAIQREKNRFDLSDLQYKRAVQAIARNEESLSLLSPSALSLPFSAITDHHPILLPEAEAHIQYYSSSYNIFFAGHLDQCLCKEQLLQTVQRLKEQEVKDFTLHILDLSCDRAPHTPLSHDIEYLVINKEIHLINASDSQMIAASFALADLFLSFGMWEDFDTNTLNALKQDIPILFYASATHQTSILLPPESVLEEINATFLTNRIVTLQNDPCLRMTMVKEQKEALLKHIKKETKCI